MTPEIIRLLMAILHYEYQIDGEWGCTHEPYQIARGECPAVSDPMTIDAVVAVVEMVGIDVVTATMNHLENEEVWEE